MGFASEGVVKLAAGTSTVLRTFFIDPAGLKERTNQLQVQK